MSDSLRNIGENYLAIRDELINMVDLETGEIAGDESLEIIQRLGNIQENFEKKAQNVALVCLELNDRKEAIKKEIERLQSLLKRAENGEKWLRVYLQEAMINTGYERITGDRVDISFRSSEETVIDDENSIPKKYFVKEVKYKISKTAIKDAIKSGVKVKGAHIEKKKNLQIK